MVEAPNLRVGPDGWREGRRLRATTGVLPEASLAQSVERNDLGLAVVGSNPPTVGVFTLGRRDGGSVDNRLGRSLERSDRRGWANVVGVPWLGSRKVGCAVCSYRPPPVPLQKLVTVHRLGAASFE